MVPFSRSAMPPAGSYSESAPSAGSTLMAMAFTEKSLRAMSSPNEPGVTVGSAAGFS